MDKEKKINLKEISDKIIEIVQPIDSFFEEKKDKERKKVEDKFYHNVERTKVFISQPWTLEHSIASSDLMEDFEDILLETHYSETVNRESVKDKWKSEDTEGERAVSVYSFLLDKKISKAIVAQKYANYLLHNKEAVSKTILEDASLKHLVNAIKHVTGGENSGV
ncbi:hypothetical protein [Halolactibacillus sp. JCM 19043]|uniref:hypothetical protein n=1 Tax=Halolactibacillus sp. JCM 19043 TaxID=1460638 RepID=UPI000780DA4D|nr:hypothetical protein [Halolactibacillus sp. JCM 19043]